MFIEGNYEIYATSMFLIMVAELMQTAGHKVAVLKLLIRMMSTLMLEWLIIYSTVGTCTKNKLNQIEY